MRRLAGLQAVEKEAISKKRENLMREQRTILGEAGRGARKC